VDVDVTGCGVVGEDVKSDADEDDEDDGEVASA